jgi:hypothetical protein
MFTGLHPEGGAAPLQHSTIFSNCRIWLSMFILGPLRE